MNEQWNGPMASYSGTERRNRVTGYWGDGRSGLTRRQELRWRPLKRLLHGRTESKAGQIRKVGGAGVVEDVEVQVKMKVMTKDLTWSWSLVWSLGVRLWVVSGNSSS